MSPRSLEETTTGSMSSSPNVSSSAAQALLVLARAAPRPPSRAADAPTIRPVRDRARARRSRRRPGSSAPRSGPGSRSGRGPSDARPPRARVSVDGTGRKSERTKTKVRAVTARGCTARCVDRPLEPVRRRLRTRSTSSRSSRSSMSLRSPFGGRQCGVAVGVVEVADEAAAPPRRSRGRARRPSASPRACRATAAAARSTPSPAVGRRRSRPSAPPRRSARGRRTRPRRARSRAAPTRPSRSRPCRRPGRYGREPATSVPEPRRRLLIVPNDEPDHAAARDERERESRAGHGGG